MCGGGLALMHCFTFIQRLAPPPLLLLFRSPAPTVVCDRSVPRHYSRAAGCEQRAQRATHSLPHQNSSSASPSPRLPLPSRRRRRPHCKDRAACWLCQPARPRKDGGRRPPSPVKTAARWASGVQAAGGSLPTPTRFLRQRALRRVPQKCGVVTRRLSRATAWARAAGGTRPDARARR